MIVPARRWYQVAVGLGVFALLGLVSPVAAPIWLGLGGLWLALLAIDAVRVAGGSAESVTLVREGTPALSVGRPLGVRYRWSHPRRIARLWIRETLPAQVITTDPTDRFLELQAGRETIEERLLVPIARGKIVSWAFDLRILSPWGLAWRQHRFDQDWAITVYPRLRDAALKQLPSQSRMRREAGLRQVRRVGEGRLFESLREWVPGDEMRVVDWKASGRRGKLIARQYEDERRQRVMLVLDAGRMLMAESDGKARLEHAIEAIGQLAYRAVSLDDDVGLLVFSDRVDHYVPPSRGRRALQGVLDVLAAVEGRLVESNYPRGFGFLATQTRRRALTVVFTDVIDRFASDALLAQLGGLRPRHLPVAVTLRDLALERLAGHRPITPGGAFERSAAEQLLAVRAEALSDLRSRGVVIVDAHPDAAAKSVVECYLRLKRRALL